MPENKATVVENRKPGWKVACKQEQLQHCIVSTDSDKQ